MSNVQSLRPARRKPAAWCVPPEPDQAAAPSRALAKLKADILGDMNHDLRTPLNGVLGLAHALAATPLTAQQREMVEHLLRSAEGLDRAIVDLLGDARGRLETAALPRRPRVLVVDDEAVTRAAVAFMLESIDAVVVEAEDGVAAVDAFAADRFDLVLMDIDMPRLDGYGAVRAMRYLEREEHRGRAAILMLSGRAETPAGETAGADFHLAKPVREGQLISTARRALSACDAGLRQSA